jgi:formylglycine-generating enzyme required for sulfatase activity
VPDGGDLDHGEPFEDCTAARIDMICERFETEWRAGRSPRIEDEFDRAEPALRDELLPHLIAIEIELRKEHGEAPAPEEYLQRFPKWAIAIVDAFLSNPPEDDLSEPGLETNADDADTPPNTTEEVDSGAFAPNGATVSDADQANGGTRTIPEEPLPERFGRYRVTGLLGWGGFGRVYLAWDDVLTRRVAVKVLHRRLFRSQEQVELFLAEARIAAGLKHSAIVQVYDVGGYDDDDVFVVFEYVPGRNLAQVFKAGRFPCAWVAGLMVRVARVAHYAHRAGLVHRDLTPSNILIEGQSEPHIADFGLAFRVDLQHLRAGEIAGNPSYMAPEQVRGETHRIDVRTDIWAMGVILYLGLVRRLPFPGRDRPKIFRAILESDPKPLHEVDPAIPRELERICLKCLSKRMDDRYETAAELADDLSTWLGARDTGLGPPRIVPKGLHAFDVEDADFFLRLVPGPRDRDGLPESIRAWKRRIEEPDPARSFAVGLLYGPSGGGKSSFVKAGLLPKLKPHIRWVYVEAAAVGTEEHMLDGLRRAYPKLPAGCGLVEAAAAIREGAAAPAGLKVLVVLDQFEQWLQGHPAETDGELVRALRHCDGHGLQALLLVRDDFWMATTRFLKALEVRPVEGTNCAAVEQFDTKHARQVLAEIGRALGRLPDAEGPEEARFLEKAVKELAAPDGHVIPVRLTLLAETLRRRDWSPATIRDLGGFQGIGELFLEQTFSARTAPPAHRQHQRAAQAVLAALLPDPSSNLKGRLRPASLLREAAGYADRPDDFAELIDILDTELRMVTLVDPSGVRVEDDAPPGSVADPRGASYYQLTHDYLVPPIRQWLTRKQTKTRRGRAELQLAATTAYWRDRPVRRRLPSVLEWLRILAFTSRRAWSADERRMMSAATRSHLTRGAAAVLIGALLGYGGLALRQRERAEVLLELALRGEYRSLRGDLSELATYRDINRPKLEALESDERADAHRRLVASVLLYHDRPTAIRAKSLHALLLNAQPDEAMVICDALTAHRELADIGELRRIVRDESSEPGARLRAACALASLARGFGTDRGSKAVAVVVSDSLMKEPQQTQASWLELLGRELSAMTIASLQGVVDRVDEPRAEDRSDERANREAAAGIALAVLGKPEALWPLLQHRDDPRLRSLLVQRLAKGGLPAHILLDRLAQPEIINPSECQTLLFVWAEMDRHGIPAFVQAGVIKAARNLYLQHPHPGVHAAAELLLRRWQDAEFVAQLHDDSPTPPAGPDGLGWMLGPNGHTFATLSAPLEFRIGSPEHEDDRADRETQQYVRINRSLAVATKEVTVEQFREFDNSHRQAKPYGAKPGCAANNVSWLEAVRYCNWLSEKANIDRRQWCYPETAGTHLVIPEDAANRYGFRLPTEAEWEYFCRAGTETARYYGQSEELLPRYAWTWLNSRNRVKPPGLLLPNEFGIFDAMGNLWEWCHDGPSRASPDAWPAYPEGTKEQPASDRIQRQTVCLDVEKGDTWRILRGGAFNAAPERSRSAHRDWASAVRGLPASAGFRVVRTLPPEEIAMKRTNPDR